MVLHDRCQNNSHIILKKLQYECKSILDFAGWDASPEQNYYLTKWLNDIKIPMVYFYKHVKENLPQTGLFPFAIVWYPK